MKPKTKLAILLLLAMTMPLLNSCTKEPSGSDGNDSVETDYKTKIIGRWLVQKFSEDIYTIDGTPFLLGNPAHGNENKVFEFSTDGSFYFDERFEGYYLIHNDSIYLHYKATQDLSSHVSSGIITKLTDTDLNMKIESPDHIDDIYYFLFLCYECEKLGI